MEVFNTLQEGFEEGVVVEWDRSVVRAAVILDDRQFIVDRFQEDTFPLVPVSRERVGEVEKDVVFLDRFFDRVERRVKGFPEPFIESVECLSVAGSR